jgi:peptide/nickel transport system ATP-binding protein
MYAGRKVEEAPVGELFERPRHPYTRGLMNSMPRLGSGHGSRNRLQEIRGMVPSLREPMPGCAFAERCPHAIDRCRTGAPLLVDKAQGHAVACWEADRLPPVVRP